MEISFSNFTTEYEEFANSDVRIELLDGPHTATSNNRAVVYRRDALAPWAAHSTFSYTLYT